MMAGRAMRRSEPRVAMRTQLSLSGSAVPSIRPSMVLNWRRISSIMSPAVAPTASMVMEATRKGTQAPISMPTSTTGSLISRETSTDWTKAAMMARAARAAAPMAKPLPMAAVVLPTLSSRSVMSRTLESMRCISARPPALSATGP